MKKNKNNEKKNWIVRMECKVIRDVYCDNCTEEEVNNNPFRYTVGAYCVDELENP